MLIITILLLIMAIAIPSLSSQLSPVVFMRITAISFIYAGVLTFNALYIQSIGSGIGIYSGLFHVSFISQELETFIYLIASLILIVLSKKTLVSKKLELNIESNNYTSEYSLIVLFTTLGSSLLISSADLISMYLSIELQSFAVYILATLYKESDLATGAGLKYFLLGALSSCLILLGIGLIYAFTGLTNLDSIYSLVFLFDNVSQGFILGLIIIFIGFLFKISAAPLHNWAPDVYDNSPTAVTIWLTIMPKIAILMFLLELQTHIGIIEYTNINFENLSTNLLTDLNVSILNNNNINLALKNLLLISSLISLIIGTVVGLAQSRIKRLLSYSTISHVGFILLALAINSEQSIDSLLFYIIQYSLTNLNTFLILIAFGYIINNSEIKNSAKFKNNKSSSQDIMLISELKSQFFANPILSLSLTICLFSMAGIKWGMLAVIA